MPWRIVDGQPQRVRVPEVSTALPPPEITPAVSPAEIELVCPHCGKEYKTAKGLDNHLDTH